MAAAWVLLDQILMVAGLFSLLGCVGAWIMRSRLIAWLLRVVNRRSFTHLGDDATLSDIDAVVFLVSRTETPRLMMEKAKPKAVGLIYTKESQTSKDELEALAREKNITCDAHVVSDPHGMLGTRQQVATLIQGLRARGHQKIAVDVTGGTTPMTLGAFIAAQESSVRSIYLATERDPHSKLPVKGSERAITVSQPEGAA